MDAYSTFNFATNPGVGNYFSNFFNRFWALTKRNKYFRYAYFSANFKASRSLEVKSSNSKFNSYEKSLLNQTNISSIYL